MKKIITIAIFIAIAVAQKAQTLTDADGNVYTTVIIGSQEWMAENLKTTKYNDNSEITLITDSSKWSKLTSPAYCFYQNNEAKYKADYGALYNWYTVNTRKLCPTGWHVPNDAEWNVLLVYLGGTDIAGGKLKEVGTQYWKDPNNFASNSTGFSAYGGGCRYPEGFFGEIGMTAIFSSLTAIDNDNISAWMLSSNYNYLYKGKLYKKRGLSVRCIKSKSSSVESVETVKDVLFYPNPAKSNITIIDGENSNSVFIISDLQGNEILSNHLTGNTIDISSIKTGIYVIRLINSKGTALGKLVKE